jgi:hypothetical protein
MYSGNIYVMRNLFQVWFMVLNATFNNISVISWQSVWLVEEIEVPRENHQFVASHWKTLSHIVVSSKPLCVSEIYVLSKERIVCVVADCYVVDHSINILSWICFAWNGRLGPLWSWSYGSWIYNYLYNQCLPPLKLWVRTPFIVGLLDTTICDKVFQWLATSWWFSKQRTQTFPLTIRKSLKHTKGMRS